MLFVDTFQLILLLFFSQGKLSGYGMEDKLPTVAIVAHYDSFGIAPVSISITEVNNT